MEMVVTALTALILAGCAVLFLRLGARARRRELPISDVVGLRTSAIKHSRATWDHVHAKYVWFFNLCAVLFIGSAIATVPMGFLDPDSLGFAICLWTLLGFMGVVTVTSIGVAITADREARRFNASQPIPGQGFPERHR